MQTFDPPASKVCMRNGRHDFRCLDGLAASRYAASVSTHISISECGTMPEAGGSDQKGQTVTKDSPPGAKIELFRSLFRGRADVYPRRFESRKTGKAGYQPACANEWVRGVCEKPKTKCADCPSRRLLPVTDEVIRWHLSRRNDQSRDFVIGVYRARPAEGCAAAAGRIFRLAFSGGRCGQTPRSCPGHDSGHAGSPAEKPKVLMPGTQERFTPIHCHVSKHIDWRCMDKTISARNRRRKSWRNLHGRGWKRYLDFSVEIRWSDETN